MTEIDVNSRLEQLEHFQNVTKKLKTKFEDLLKSSSLIQSSATTPKSLASSSTKSYVEPICTNCSDNKLSCSEGDQLTDKTTVCDTCSSDADLYSPIWLRSRTEKLEMYENAIRESGRLTEPEMAVDFNDGHSSTGSSDTKKTFAEMTKYERDVKRKRMKHRTTKAPPLTHTEELRSLISVQMDLWEDYVVRSKKVRRSKVNKETS